MNETAPDQVIVETVERIARAEFPKYQNENHYNTIPKELFKTLSETGLAGLSISEEFGGLGASATTIAMVFETISRFDVGPAIFVSVHAMVSGLINRWGSLTQKKGLLPRLASGELLAAFALTEPQAGSDAQALSTEATPCQGGFKLKGSKCYITSAGFADIYLVFAKTRKDTETGFSAFIVTSDTPGLTFGKPEKKMGAELSPIASLFFEDAFVPENALLGSLNQGFKVALSGLASGRVTIAACANGLSTAALDAAIAHVKERHQFGKPLADFQGLQFMIADMYQKLQAARLLTMRAAQELDRLQGGDTTGINTKISSSTAKCFATDAAMSITTDAVQLLGGAGYIKEYAVERYMRDAKMLQIVEGANQVQRMIIARELLQ